MSFGIGSLSVARHSRFRGNDGNLQRPCFANDTTTQPTLRLYATQVMLQNMKISERGQVTIPKDLRERFGLRPETEVEFQVVNNSILLRKKPRKLNLTRWKGLCGKSFKELGYTRVDEFIEDVRGR